MSAEDFKSEEFDKWLASFPKQIDGQPIWICETGDPYICFQVANPCRIEDIEVGKKACIQIAKNMLSNYLNNRNGKIYWRIRPEFAVYDSGSMIPNEREWKTVGFYCRVHRALI